MSQLYFTNIISKSIIPLQAWTRSSLLLCSTIVKNNKNGGKIVASGLGKNVPICEKFVGTMNSLGLESAFIHTNTAMHGDLGLIKEKDLVLILSKSGSTAESCLFVEYIRDWKAEKWLLSFNDEGILANELDKSYSYLLHRGRSMGYCSK